MYPYHISIKYILVYLEFYCTATLPAGGYGVMAKLQPQFGPNHQTSTINQWTDGKNGRWSVARAALSSPL